MSCVPTVPFDDTSKNSDTTSFFTPEQHLDKCLSVLRTLSTALSAYTLASSEATTYGDADDLEACLCRALEEYHEYVHGCQPPDDTRIGGKLQRLLLKVRASMRVLMERIAVLRAKAEGTLKARHDSTTDEVPVAFGGKITL